MRRKLRWVSSTPWSGPIYAHLSRHPATGSPRYAHELNLPGLRVWPLKRYPHLVFYLEHADHVDVWRVLHGERDIPAWLRDPEPI